jgi:hypothetical protein
MLFDKMRRYPAQEQSLKQRSRLIQMQVKYTPYFESITESVRTDSGDCGPENAA